MNLRYIPLTLLSLVSQVAESNPLRQVWESCSSCRQPESVYYDESSGHLFVSNISGEGTAEDKTGWISVLDDKGGMITTKWVEGLNAPKGLRAFKDTLWVADINRVIAINSQTKAQKVYKIEEAKFLNDVAIDHEGAVYVSDTIGSKIYQIKDGKVEVFVEGKEWDSPNGLLVVGQYLYVASWGLTTDFSTKTPGGLYAINLKNKKQRWLSREVGNLDGLERDRKGRFVSSDWSSGKIYRFTKRGTHPSIIAELGQGAADIAIIQRQNTIVVPQMKKNRVTALEMIH